MIKFLINLLSGPNQNTVLMVLIGFGLVVTLLPLILISISDSKKDKAKKASKPADIIPKPERSAEVAETMDTVKAMLDMANASK